MIVRNATPAVGALLAGNAPHTLRRVAGCANNVAGLFDGLDIGQHDGAQAHVEILLDQVFVEFHQSHGGLKIVGRQHL